MKSNELLWLLGAVVFWVAAGVALLALTSCTPPPPYVYKKAEFDRDNPTFNKPLDVRDGVVVCYNEDSTTPAEIRGLAQQACATEGGKAVFVTHVYDKCPAMLIAGAHFSCGLSVEPEPIVQSPARPQGTNPRIDAQGAPATPSAIYEMHYQAPAR
ncbi:hypothetical protein [Magnetospira sp. QH-2]|uniref:hypothetical protein n=1 Tax=Magnetospira sp. (strain QH-2) TaxID=1288970 RepID=UPI0003E80F04|nr:hypothetical protein [Magnetospira sp. QH-2]CCQ73529.1 Exported protein of unknown function [Magnetospira sp. QH-2]